MYYGIVQVENMTQGSLTSIIFGFGYGRTTKSVRIEDPTSSNQWNNSVKRLLRYMVGYKVDVLTV